VLHQGMASRQHLDPEIAITAKVQQINVVVLYQFIMAVRVSLAYPVITGLQLEYYRI